ncbi:MAG: hypothetical protein E7478_04410 [Ruminococcaceae bacterium]|nr:hypothetical protein [Oscillospiraceae bacterium]
MKIKKLLAGVLAAVVAVTSSITMQISSVAADSWYKPIAICDGSSADYSEYGLASNFASEHTDADKVILNLTMTNGNWGYGNGNIYVNVNDNQSATVRQFNDSRVGSTSQPDNGDLYFTEGVATQVELDLAGRDLTQWHGIAIQAYGAVIELTSLELYKEDELLTTVRGEEVVPVAPTGDITLTPQSAEDSELTYTDHGDYTTGSSWLIDFDDQIKALADAANYQTIYGYLENFDHIEFTVNVSEYSGDVTIPGLTIKAHGMSADWTYYGGDELMLPLPDVNKDLIYVLPVSKLQDVDYSSIGIIIEDPDHYNTDGQSASISYSVDAKLCADELAPFATSLTVTPNSTTINKGETAKFTAVTDVETDIEWGTSNTDVATVSDDGTVTGVGKGSSDLIVTINAKFALHRFTEYGKITVTNYATDLGVPESITMGVGTSYVINIYPTPADVSNLDTRYSIADDTVAELKLQQDYYCKIEALEAGTTTLTVTDTYSGVTETCTITVTDELASGSYGSDDNSATYRQLTESEADDFNPTKFIVQNDITPELGMTYCQYSEGTYRFFVLVEESFLADKESASIAIRGKTNKVFELTTTKAYKNLSPTVSAPEGQVFIVFAVTDAPEPVNGISNTTCDMKWSGIKFTEKEEN